MRLRQCVRESEQRDGGRGGGGRERHGQAEYEGGVQSAEEGQGERRGHLAFPHRRRAPLPLYLAVSAPYLLGAVHGARTVCAAAFLLVALHGLSHYKVLPPCCRV